MRHKDWRVRLGSYLESVKYTGFKWGAHDCCYFAANCIEHMTGEIVELPTYNSRGSALRALQDRNTTVSGFVSSILPEVMTVDAVREGDLVMMEGENAATVGLLATDGPLGIYYNEAVWIPGRIGTIQDTNLGNIYKAWRI